jgi:hypothetical protein
MRHAKKRSFVALVTVTFTGGHHVAHRNRWPFPIVTVVKHREASPLP